jgi:hypothetical protein
MIMFFLAGSLVAVYHWWYYRELNAIIAGVSELPNVRLISATANEDFTLEEIRLDLVVDGRHTVKWFLPEEPFNRATMLRSVPALVLHTASADCTYAIGPGSTLEQTVGAPLRGGQDVLKNLSLILQTIESGTIPVDPTPDDRNALYLTIGPDL